MLICHKESHVQSLQLQLHIRGDTNALNETLDTNEALSQQEAVHVTEVTQDTIHHVKREKSALNFPGTH